MNAECGMMNGKQTRSGERGIRSSFIIHHSSFRVLLPAIAFSLQIATGTAYAQQFPVKPVRVINPAAPGGNSDIFFRILSPKMSEILGQSVIIDYRPGRAARSAPT